MRLALTDEQETLQRELRGYFESLVDDVEGAATDEPTYTRYIARMGLEESHWAGVPLPLLTLNSVGPTLMVLGTDERSATSCRASWRASCTSRSVTPSRARARTWRRSRPGPCATGTSTS